MKEKVVLAYSGGLDTTAIIPWLKENYDCEVICCCIDVGQKEELDGLEERAKACGASKLYIKNVVDEYVENYIMPTVQADAVFEYKYLLGTATARPLIAKVLVDVARQEGATAICHGATGKGNDQIRFELGIKALAPELKIIAAWRDPKWTMDSRESEIEYCRAHGINLPFSADNSYSRDRNIWHISHEGLELEDPSCAPNYDHLLVLSNSPEKAPEEDVHLSIDWEKGVPVALNGEKMSQREILEKLNEIKEINNICNVGSCSGYLIIIFNPDRTEQMLSYPAFMQRAGCSVSRSCIWSFYGILHSADQKSTRNRKPACVPWKYGWGICQCYDF